MKTVSLLVLLSSLFGAPVAGRPGAAQDSVRVGDLRCEYLTNPLAVDVTEPRLSWVPESAERGQKQTAYQIIAESSDAPLWNSGKVASGESTHVPWGGRTLVSGQRVTWKVRVWDREGTPSAFSTPASFEMGLLTASDWKGKWIGAAETQEYVPNMPRPSTSSARWIWSGDGPTGERFFRTQFELDSKRKVVQARTFFVGDDRLVVYLNGKEVLRGTGTEHFAYALPSALVRPGTNTLTVAAANDAGPAGVFGQLVVDLDEGPPIAIATSGKWRQSRSLTDEDASRFTEVKEVARFGDRPWGRPRFPAKVPPAPLLRRTFSVAKPIRAARAYIAGLGYGELHLNGQKVSDHVLDPGFTRFDKRALYVVHDVTPLMKQGANAVGVILGNGFFNVHAQDTWLFHEAPWRATPRLLFQMRLDYEDGSSETVVSDASWKTATGPVVLDGIRNGESYDARLEREGWATAAFDDEEWNPAAVVKAPTTTLSAQMLPPMKVTETIKPIAIKEPKPGVFVVDMGQNFAGWARLQVEGPKGTKVTLRYGEKLYPDGTVDQSNLDTHVFQGPFQTDSYVLKDGPQTWEPRFTYHGFQYVEVHGWPGKPTPESITGRVVHTAFRQSGTIETSNDLINKIQRATLWSYRGNFHSVPTDCPHREKNGWTGDGHVAAELAMFNFDNAASYAKWTRDLRDEQQPSGAVPGIVPTGGWGYTWGNGPAWDSALLIVPWTVYQHTGDRRILTESYEHFKRYVDYVGTLDYLTRNPSGWLGDWVAPKDKTPPEMTHTGYHHLDAKITAETARLAGKPDEAARYEAVAAGVRKAFRDKYLDRTTGEVTPATQTALTMALYQGLAEGRDRETILRQLLTNIAARKDHLDFGLLGSKYFSHALTDAGHADVVYRMVTQKDFPSWGHWFEKGATTLWEDWHGNGSRNHIFLGDVSAWFWKALAGINPDPAAPGFAHIVFRPEPVGDLTWVRGSTRTLRGEIRSEWRKEAGVLTMKVTVPVTSTATVLVPAAANANVDADGGKLVRTEARHRVYEIGSGTYTFVVAPPK